MYVGKLSDGSFTFNGKIVDFELLNKALSEEEIADEYNEKLVYPKPDVKLGFAKDNYTVSVGESVALDIIAEEGCEYTLSVVGSAAILEGNVAKGVSAGESVVYIISKDKTLVGMTVVRVVDNSHTHVYKTMNDETNHWNECDCGDKTDITVHTWDDGAVTKEATYDEEGEKTFTCLICSKKKVESVEKLIRVDDTTTDTDDTDKGTDTTEQPSGGCRSVIGVGVGSIVMIVMICCAFVFLKKKTA
jgi:hypothetical protein